MINVQRFSFRVLLMAGMAAATSSIFAQEVFVLCEGAMDFASGEVLEAPRLGRFNAAEEVPVFETLHIFEGHAFAVDAQLASDGQEILVSAEDTVYRMDATTGEILAQQAVEGARQLHVHGDRVFVTRGDYDGQSVMFDSYLVALEAETLTWEADWAADAMVGPAFSTEALATVDGVLHIGINNAFAWGEEVGLVGRLNLETGAYDEVDLGPEGLNPVHVLDMGDAVVTVNARQYEATSLSRVTAGTDAVTATVAATTAGCGAAARIGEDILFQVYGEGNFRRADGAALTDAGSWPGNGSAVYSMAVAEDGRILLGNTDFIGSGHVEVRQADGALMHTVETGIAPGRIVLSPTVNAVGNMEDAAAGAEIVSRHDLMGRPVSHDAPGLQLVRFANGRVKKVFQAQ